jgi:hypothetical protein
MATIKLLLGIFCFAVTGSIGLLKRDLLVQKGPGRTLAPVDEMRERLRLVQFAVMEIGVREKTGQNDGIRVEAYLASVDLKKGLPWCGAFISWVFKKAGYAEPRTGWTPALFPSSRLARSALPGNLLGVYFPKLKRIAHVGLIERLDGDWCLSVEGNTNFQGSNEGDGIFRKRRHVKTIYQIADWVKNGRRIR